MQNKATYLEAVVCADVHARHHPHADPRVHVQVRHRGLPALPLAFGTAAAVTGLFGAYFGQLSCMCYLSWCIGSLKQAVAGVNCMDQIGHLQVVITYNSQRVLQSVESARLLPSGSLRQLCSVKLRSCCTLC